MQEAVPKARDVLAKLADGLKRLTELRAVYPKRVLPSGVAAEKIANTKVIAGSFGAIKCGIEAAINLFELIKAVLAAYENHAARRCRPGNWRHCKLGPAGAGHLPVDLDEVAG